MQDRLVVDLVIESVAAEENSVSHGNRYAEAVRLVIGIGSDSPCNNVLSGVIVSFFSRDRSHLDQIVYVCMIIGYLLDESVVYQIYSAVADIRNIHLVFSDIGQKAWTQTAL